MWLAFPRREDGWPNSFIESASSFRSLISIGDARNTKTRIEYVALMSPSTRDVLPLSRVRTNFSANGVEDINSMFPHHFMCVTAQPQQKETLAIGNAFHSLCIIRNIAWGKGLWEGLHQAGAGGRTKVYLH